MQPRGDGPFQVVEKIHDNAYKLDLPGEFKVSATFNVSDLSPFDAGSDSRTNPFEEGGDDVIQDAETTRASQWKDPLIVEDGPMTRLRANRIKQAMGLLAQATVDDVMSYTQKEASSMLGSKSESTWINVLEAAEDEGENYFYAAA